MRKTHKRTFVLLLTLAMGCQSANKEKISFPNAPAPALSDNIYQSLVPQESVSTVEASDQHFDSGPLNDFNFNDPGNFMRLSLDQCIESALRDSEVIRELGGTVLRTPEVTRTSSDPALAYTNPINGEEAALSAFDATFNNQFSFQNNDRAFNSSFVGDQGIFQQKLLNNTTSLSKRSATGGQFQLLHQLQYDLNNTQANRFTNDVAYDTFVGGEVRQPILQGNGVLFNRIAGPNNLPGVNNGVLIARTNTDINLADFEIGIRNLVSEVENAYWDLYFAYRDLEAKIEARNGAYEIWNRLKADAGNKKKTEILQAEEQYYLFAARVKDAIHGQLNDGTRTFNGSSSGTFRGNAGVRTAERRLRLISGYPVNDGLLIVPQDTPVEAAVMFDWEQVKRDALTMRTELRRQRWVMKREELGLIANKNHLLPSLDLVGRYRVRGFGNDLFGNTAFDASIDPGVDPQNNSSATQTLLDGDFQEWEVGMDFNVPIGFRRQMAAVRNSELNLTRERKILHEQERNIIYGLSNALGEIERTSSLMQANMHRLKASEEQYSAIQEDYQNDDTTIDLVLESQRRVIDAKLDYFRAQVEFMLAVKAVHFEKGTVLNYHNVALSESGWSGEEYRQALDRERRKSAPLNYVFHGLKVSEPLGQLPMGFVEPGEVLLTDGNSANETKQEEIDPERASLLVEVAKRLDEENDPKNKIAKIAKKFSGQADAGTNEGTSESEASSSEELTKVLAEKKSLLARLHAKSQESLTPSQARQADPDSLSSASNLADKAASTDLTALNNTTSQLGQSTVHTLSDVSASAVRETSNSSNDMNSGREGLVENAMTTTTEQNSPSSATFQSYPENLVIDPLAGMTSLPPVPSLPSPHVKLTDSAPSPITQFPNSPSSVGQASAGGKNGASSRRLQSSPSLPTNNPSESFGDSPREDSVRISLGDSQESTIHR